jgi:hypothetical protein
MVFQTVKVAVRILFSMRCGGLEVVLLLLLALKNVNQYLKLPHVLDVSEIVEGCSSFYQRSSRNPKI